MGNKHQYERMQAIFNQRDYLRKSDGARFRVTDVKLGEYRVDKDERVIIVYLKSSTTDYKINYSEYITMNVNEDALNELFIPYTEVAKVLYGPKI